MIQKKKSTQENSFKKNAEKNMVNGFQLNGVKRIFIQRNSSFAACTSFMMLEF